MRRMLAALAVAGSASLGLFAVRVLVSGSVRYWFLAWNLLLAWLPIVFALLLVRSLRRYSWNHWQSIVLFVLWLGFLPNSFYLVSDLIHLRATGEVSLLYDAAMFFLFIFNGYVYGMASLLIVHRELYRRFLPIVAHAAIGAVLLLCSFAIYLGRYLRWNTWDVLINPAGLLVDISDRVVNPLAHEQTFAVTLVFFVLLGSIYVVVWQGLQFVRSVWH